MNTKLDEMKEDLQKWESELNDLIAMRNMIMSSPNLNHIDLTKTNEIIKRKEDTINEAKLIIDKYEFTDNDLPPTYEEYINQ